MLTKVNSQTIPLIQYHGWMLKIQYHYTKLSILLFYEKWIYLVLKTTSF